MVCVKSSLRFFESGHSDSSIAMRTGHRNQKSLKSYQNLRFGTGFLQQQDVFGEENDPVINRSKFETVNMHKLSPGFEEQYAPRVDQVITCLSHQFDGLIFSVTFREG